MKRFDNLLAYFLPHPQTHQKAHLLSWHFLLIYVLLFVLLRVGIDLVNIYRPGVLGVNSNITVEKIIEGTNKERQKLGLSPLKENSSLAQAAGLKAANMFEENYWAHFSPSGKDPWGFMTKSGYKFVFAGENLAKNFATSEDVVVAWMNSPTHRENIINPNYDDIGIAVVDGVLQGQKTTLVVQMFGRGFSAVATAPQVNLGGQKIALQASDINKPNQVLMVQTKAPQKPQELIGEASINPFFTTQVFGVALFSLIAILLIMDFITLKRRGVFRLSSHHLAHLSFLAIAGASVILGKVGDIL